MSQKLSSSTPININYNLSFCYFIGKNFTITTGGFNHVLAGALMLMRYYRQNNLKVINSLLQLYILSINPNIINKITIFTPITINIEHNKTVEKISYTINEEKLSKAFSGSYFIRTNRTDLDERNIKEIYTLLLQIENSFRTLKSQLSLRPNFHQLQERIEAHIFLTTLAY
ncbi:MAG: transposase, partial [bacterium]